MNRGAHIPADSLGTTAAAIVSTSSPFDSSGEVPQYDSNSPLMHKKDQRRLLMKLGFSFFMFGLINNVLYVIILSAALDLVPPSTPKGIIAFCNIAPALVAKVGWPYILRGKIRYTKRLVGCSLLSSLGMILVAAFENLPMRLLGISLASFSSGLGELTFLQLSTRYHPASIAGRSVGYFASGTGAAGLVGAYLWWEVRGLGVRIGVGLSALIPAVLPLTYVFLLPAPTAFQNSSSPNEYEGDATGVPPTAPYIPIATSADDEECDVPQSPHLVASTKQVSLSASDKWTLVRPMLIKYMLPLFCVYLFEYTINQGIGPTLIYPVPTPDRHPILSLIIKSIRDYYPLWQLVYQATVFLSRSSISLGIPPLPERFLPLPAVLQLCILFMLSLESGVGIVPEGSEGIAITAVLFLIALEGICGGLAYVNVFYRVNQERASMRSRSSGSSSDAERQKQEKEFKIGSIGFADSLGILLASIVAVPAEITLCDAQARRGKLLCKEI